MQAFRHTSGLKAEGWRRKGDRAIPYLRWASRTSWATIPIPIPIPRVGGTSNF